MPGMSWQGVLLMSQTICTQCGGAGVMNAASGGKIGNDGNARTEYPVQAVQPCSQCKGAGYYQGMGS